MGAVVLGHFGESRLVVTTRMLVAAPGIHAVAAAFAAGPLRRLAEGEIGIAAVHAQLDEHSRAQHFDQRHGEGNVLLPGDWSSFQ